MAPPFVGMGSAKLKMATMSMGLSRLALAMREYITCSIPLYVGGSLVLALVVMVILMIIHLHCFAFRAVVVEDSAFSDESCLDFEVVVEADVSFFC